MNFEILATVFGLVQGALIMFNKRCNWIFYVLQMLALIVFSYQATLYGDVLLNSLFVLFGVWAYCAWNKKLANISTTNWHWIWHCLATGVFSVGLFYILKEYTNDVLPLKDAITTTFGFLATVYMVMRKLETWLVWFAVDVLYVWQYATLPEPAWYLVVLNVIWTAMAVGSFIVWLRQLRKH